ncbi:MAG: hypothetical protein CO182_12220, partial [Lysobacterales bacterium CG_4_9_14_3_um_filter_62_6]
NIPARQRHAGHAELAKLEIANRRRRRLPIHRKPSNGRGRSGQMAIKKRVISHADANSLTSKHTPSRTASK